MVQEREGSWTVWKGRTVVHGASIQWKVLWRGPPELGVLWKSGLLGSTILCVHPWPSSGAWDTEGGVWNTFTASLLGLVFRTQPKVFCRILQGSSVVGGRAGQLGRECPSSSGGELWILLRAFLSIPGPVFFKLRLDLVLPRPCRGRRLPGTGGQLGNAVLQVKAKGQPGFPQLQAVKLGGRVGGDLHAGCRLAFVSLETECPQVHPDLRPRGGPALAGILAPSSTRPHPCGAPVPWPLGMWWPAASRLRSRDLPVGGTCPESHGTGAGLEVIPLYVRGDSWLVGRRLF